jgi:hypothetical protein
VDGRRRKLARQSLICRGWFTWLYANEVLKASVQPTFFFETAMQPSVGHMIPSFNPSLIPSPHVVVVVVVVTKFFTSTTHACSKTVEAAPKRQSLHTRRSHNSKRPRFSDCEDVSPSLHVASYSTFR